MEGTPGALIMYPNKEMKRIRKSYILRIECSNCNCVVAHYQKVGGPNLLRMYVDRMIDSSMDLSFHPKVLLCVECGAVIANMYKTKDTKKEAYRMIPGSFYKQRL